MKHTMTSTGFGSVTAAIFVAATLGLLGASASAQVAFPGAEGFGQWSEGGRGGDVYIVTNLNDSGAGSLRQAINASGPRTVVFEVSGTISLNSPLYISNPRITIAGQTAPGDGICLKNHGLVVNANNVIVRHIRSRLGDNDGDVQDAMSVTGGNNIILDHVSASWGVDEVLSVGDNASNVTVQWSIISEGLRNSIHPKGAHSYGALVRGHEGAGVSYHHNVFAHNEGRNPRPGNYLSHTEDPEGLLFDFRNNVVYNWGGTVAGYNDDTDSVSKYNFINNYYKAGPDSDGSLAFRQRIDDYCRAYFAGNAMNGSVPGDPWSLVTGQTGGSLKLGSALAVAPVTTESATDAYDSVLASAGASKPRDSVDERIVRQIRNGWGSIIDDEADVGGWPTLNSTAPSTDTDRDGMPDYWETTRGLDLNNAAHRNRDRLEDGYTNLEEYINDMPGGVWNDGSSAGSKWGQEDNWDKNTVPTWDDTAILTLHGKSANRLTSYLGQDRTIKSILFNSHADADVKIGLSDGAGTGRKLTFGANTGNASVTVDSGAAGTLDLRGHTERINALLGDGTVDNTKDAAAHLEVGAANASGTFSGTLKNTGKPLSLTKIGNGTLTLSGANTYSGDTTIEAGTLRLGASHVIPNASTVTINNSGSEFDLNGNRDRVMAFYVNPSPTSNGELTYTHAAGETLVTSGNVQLGGAPDAGSNRRGNVTQNGGTVDVEGDLVFGGAANTEGGTYNLNAGNLSVAGSVIETAVSVDNAQLQINGGTLSVGGNIKVQRFSLGEDATSSGASYTVAAGRNVESTGTTAVGNYGANATLTVQGTYTAANMSIGDTDPGSSGTFVLDGGGLTVDGVTTVGDFGTGKLEIRSGAANFKGQVRAGEAVGGNGAIEVGVGGGAPTVAVAGASTELGQDGGGGFRLDSGEWYQNSNNFVQGQNNTSTSTVIVNGGRLDLTAHTPARIMSTRGITLPKSTTAR